MKKSFKALCILAFAFNLTACAEFASENTYKQLEAINLGKKPDLGDIPSCQVDTAEYLLDLELLTFELKDKYGGSFGFDLLTGFFRVLGFNLKLSRGEMVVAMDATRAVNPGAVVALANGKGTSKDNEFSFNLNVGQWGLDLGYFYRTPLHKLMDKTLNDALKNLNASLNKNSAPWNSRVFHIGDDNLIVIPAGQVAGIRVGDKFNVYNVEYIWQGTPCESPLLIEKKSPLEPVATIEAVQVEDHATLLSITSASELSLQLGARVEVLELPLLKGEKSRSLARPVRVREITSLPLELPNGQKMDLVPYSESQLRVLFSNHQMYPSM